MAPTTPTASPTQTQTHTVHAVSGRAPTTPTSSTARHEALDWMSVVKSHKLMLEHAAVDINTDRVLYHMELELATPLPQNVLDHGQFICLSWPYGGLWKVERVREKNTKLSCLAWRKTELTPAQVEDQARAVEVLASKVEDEGSAATTESAAEPALLAPEEEERHSSVSAPPPQDEVATLFQWKMTCGEWGSDGRHWFIRDVEPPQATAVQPPPRRQLVAKLFVGFAPLEAQIEVNAVTALDTVAQTYSADVTWQVTLPAITTFREDVALLEFLEILEIDAEQFEFSNVVERKDERDLSSSVTPAGYVQFRDLTLPGEPGKGETAKASDRPHIEPVYHLQFSRRIVASFTEEMALHLFPFDQQKLVFEFSTGSNGMPDGALHLIPTPVEPGSFSVENYQLGNIFDVAYHNKIFVNEIKESGPRKAIAFEMVLERRSMYYLTNVALIASIITYLCFFVSWSPVEWSSSGDGTDGDNKPQLMDIGTRLQNVTAMVLTAVTFKNQVASLIPQISYFTILDSYVFVCFIVTSLVTIENALFPLWKKLIAEGKWDETSLLGYSLGMFTVLNIVWALYLKRWLDRRRHAAHVLMQVHEYIRVITRAIPAKFREEVFHRFLEAKNFEAWCLPKYLITSSGDIHLQAPDDRPTDTSSKSAKREKRATKQRLQAESELATLQKIFFDLRPNIDRHASCPVVSSPVAHALPPVSTKAAVYQAGQRRLSRMDSALPSIQELVGGRRAVSAHNHAEDTVVNVASFRRYRDAHNLGPRYVRLASASD